MIEAQPSDRFDQTEFSNETTNGTALSLRTVWHCPDCGEGISFSKDHFEDRVTLDFTNLPSTIAGEFDQWAENKNLSTLTFLDWQCPSCQMSSRAYVEKWAGGRHGDAGVSIVALIEKSNTNR